jgi:Mn-dependent DtxR family transcriptional regulator
MKHELSLRTQCNHHIDDLQIPFRFIKIKLFVDKLLKYVNMKHSKCWCSQHFLAREMGCSQDTVKRYLRILEDLGWITRKTLGRTEYLNAIKEMTGKDCKLPSDKHVHNIYSVYFNNILNTTSEDTLKYFAQKAEGVHESTVRRGARMHQNPYQLSKLDEQQVSQSNLEANSKNSFLVAKQQPPSAEAGSLSASKFENIIHKAGFNEIPPPICGEIFQIILEETESQDLTESELVEMIKEELQPGERLYKFKSLAASILQLDRLGNHLGVDRWTEIVEDFIVRKNSNIRSKQKDQEFLQREKDKVRNALQRIPTESALEFQDRIEMLQLQYSHKPFWQELSQELSNV